MGLKTKFGGQLQVCLTVFKGLVHLVAWHHDVTGIYEKVNGNTFNIVAGMLAPLSARGDAAGWAG